MTDNIISMPTPMNVLAERIRSGRERAQKGEREWIMGMADQAVALWEARQRFKANIEFSHWLVENDLDHHSKDDRAAMITLADECRKTDDGIPFHSDIIFIFERGAELGLQPASLLREHRSRLLRYVARVVSSSTESKTTVESDKCLQPPNTSLPTAETDTAPEQKVVNQESGSALTKRSALAHIQRGEELASVFRSDKARTMLGNFPKQRGGKYILSLVLEALDAGLIPPNDLQPHQPTISLLFPLAPAGFVRPYRLDNPKLRPQIRKMLDTMIACRPKLLAEPHRIREILADYEAEQKAKIRAEIDSKRRNDAIARLASNQQELVVFGTTVWPRLDDKQGPYDYDQIRAAIWTFRDQLAWNKITNDNSPGSIGIRIRLSMKWYNEYLMRVDPLRESPCRRVFNLVFWLSKLYEAAPDAECKWPAYPTAEAEW